jgi:hypothetical protein
MRISTVKNAPWETQTHTNAHWQMGSGLKNLVFYQLKWFRQRKRKEKQISGSVS